MPALGLGAFPAMGAEISVGSICSLTDAITAANTDRAPNDGVLSPGVGWVLC